MSTSRPLSFTEVRHRTALLGVLLGLSIAGCSGQAKVATPTPTAPSEDAAPAALESPAERPAAVTEGTPAETDKTGTPEERDGEAAAAKPNEVAPEAAAAKPNEVAPETAAAKPNEVAPETAAATPSGGSLDDLAALVSSFEGPTPSLKQLRAASSNPEAGLIQLARDGSQVNAVRQGALRALGTTAGGPAQALLGEMLAPETSRALRRAAIQGADPLLSRNSDLAAFVTTAMRDDDPGVARAAVLALADLPGARADLEALGQEALAPAVRSAVDKALGNQSTTTVPIAAPTSTGRENRGGR